MTDSTNKKNAIIFKQISLVMNDIRPISKDGTNKFQNFKYRSIDAVCDSLQPLFAKHSIFIVPSEEISREYVESLDRKKNRVLFCRVSIKYKVCAEDGSFIEGIGIGEGLDNSDKSTGKATTYAYKDFLTKLFCIPFSMNDPDKDYIETNKPPQKSPKQKLAAKIDKVASCGNPEAVKCLFKELTQVEKNLIGKNIDSALKSYIRKAESHNLINNLEPITYSHNKKANSE